MEIKLEKLLEIQTGLSRKILEDDSDKYHTVRLLKEGSDSDYDWTLVFRFDLFSWSETKSFFLFSTNNEIEAEVFYRKCLKELAKV